MTYAEGLAQVTDADFDTEVLGAGTPVLVKFTAQWCGPCRQLKPVLGAIAAEVGEERLRIVEMDVDHNPLTTVRYGVLGTPTLLVFDRGEPVRSLVGARPKRRLLEELADVLEPSRA
ncbi:thioredoxin family protein [Streptomyces showdoensis]|uniref:Thioredoxin n=1 Tax=Streptomyces showdoensis TaxID=68268 RepID=A0A2P2GD23_STREW|nr:thioredoxin domain-containing protein [Streptomyces showdoensis]KKZ69401.1 thioredoxin [Streptomyces showdoensis]